MKTTQNNWEELKEKFWDKVLFCSPDEIKGEEIGIVSDENIDWLIRSVEEKAMEEWRKEGDLTGFDRGWKSCEESLKKHLNENVFEPLKNLIQSINK